MTKQKLNYIHSFRALAIIFIVAGHAIDIFSWENSSEEHLFRIFISNGSALFVFIAGYLFQHLLVKYEAIKYFRNKFNNVIVPYFIVSMPALILFTSVMQRPNMPDGFYEHSIIYQISYFLLNGAHLAPFWFIPMITIFYAISPLLKYLDKKTWFYLLIPLFYIVSFFFQRDSVVYSFLHFFSIYVLGMFFSHYKFILNPYLSRTPVILVFFLISLVFALLEFQEGKETMTWMNLYQKSFMAIFVLGLFISFNDLVNNEVVNKVADYSFGIFFIHSYFISLGKVIYQYIYNSLPSYNLFWYVFSVVFVVTICMTVIHFIKNAFGTRSRYIVGS